MIQQLENGFSIRPISLNDFEEVKDTLSALTVVGEISPEIYASLLKYWDTLYLDDNKTKVYNVHVIVDSSGTICAVGTIFLEKKIIHCGGIVGHIEDISVNKKCQGMKLGKLLIEHLTNVGRKAGCYKIILDCDVKNTGFYEKCGYSNAGVEMQIRF
ncbi:hypothetical protein KAFR_0C03360 [Kazachstania africana CBS 2517]|uniref:Glucosamine 6-phosphate N-acetyltransferase n=1 Tax=Kazachstania africana (strain ATCC 22294 / BCRC 22015 / CBS 2517 / CECT 1963 / NBRC 1671 / NRRL Y-8276) TaxID=1071382 RepID=H2ASH8_KAZAF|nr:hypothetical protein KAFR_0C03360 [Kazachstania africana CBS 2517]CCF57328.1 hypothetical protein KAFR_0C03360 [Kazachstania africana CBS 2517]